MPLHPTWEDIALRLTLTMIAGGIIGFNRGARGEAAGFRTTILVGLAASVAMIQANILLSIGGKTADSFGVMDLMRLPLGILTGVGFIGGGAIMKRGDLVIGVTTAATLWVITVIGLCFGGDQLGLGVVATLLGAITRRACDQGRPRIVFTVPVDGPDRADGLQRPVPPPTGRGDKTCKLLVRHRLETTRGRRPTSRSAEARQRALFRLVLRIGVRAAPLMGTGLVRHGSGMKGRRQWK